MKVLSLGATDNFGSRALPALIKQHGYTVIAYVHLPSIFAPEKRAIQTDVVFGSVLDKSALKAAILGHGCNAVFYTAGVVQMLGRSKTGEYNRAFAAVVAAIVEAREERSGPTIRAWLMSGFPMLDSAISGHLIGSSIHMCPKHKETPALMRKENESDIAESLFYAK